MKVLRNQGLLQTLEKFQFLPIWVFFSLLTTFFSDLWYKPSFFSSSGDLEKKSRFAGPEIFLRFEADLDFSRPWFSEIRMQIKRLMEIKVNTHRRNFSCHSFAEMNNVLQNNVTFKRRSIEQWCVTFLSVQTSQI